LEERTDLLHEPTVGLLRLPHLADSGARSGLDAEDVVLATLRSCGLTLGLRGSGCGNGKTV
jgi:hypothetical protein